MTRFALPLMAAALLAACNPSTNQTDVATSGQVVTSGTAQIGGDWSLVDHTGTARTQDDYLGKPQLIYFGFAYCPDVCPASLSRMGAIMERTDPDGDDINTLFITVDPERDTPEAMAQYITAGPFPDNLVGLTGSPEALQSAREAFRIYAAKVEDEESASDYLFDHSDYIIVMSPDGSFHDIISADESVEAAAVQLRRDFGIS